MSSWNLISSWLREAIMFSNYERRYTIDFILQNSKGKKIYQFFLCDKTMYTNHKLPNSYSKPEQTPGNAVKSAKFIHCVLPPPSSMPFFLLAPSALPLCPSAWQNSKHYFKKKIWPYPKAPLRSPPCTSGTVFHMDTDTKRAPEFS